MERPQPMDQKQAIWIKDPLAILADGAERGIVVRNGRIAELVPAGREPAPAGAAGYEAAAQVGLPRLVHAPHPLHQTPNAAPPAGADAPPVPGRAAQYP